MIMNDLKEDFRRRCTGNISTFGRRIPRSKIDDRRRCSSFSSYRRYFRSTSCPKSKQAVLEYEKGAFMASTDEIHIRIIGKGGHAALPNEYINPVEVGIDLLKKLKKI